MATTYNFTDGSISGQPKVNDTLPNSTGMFVRSNTVDFANQNIEAGAADVAQVINIPADTYVLQVMMRVLTAETASGTCDLGTDLDVDQWGDALAITATGMQAGLLVPAVPEYFADANTIDITATTDTADVDLDAFKCEIVALMVPGNKSDLDGASNAST